MFRERPASFGRQVEICSMSHYFISINEDMINQSIYYDYPSEFGASLRANIHNDSTLSTITHTFELEAAKFENLIEINTNNTPSL